MLRLWRPELRIGLRAKRLVAVRYARGFSHCIENKRLIAVPGGEASAPWTNAVAALQGLLSELENRAAQVTVVLSSRFVRYALLPWTKTLKNPVERLAYARHTFVTTYGAAATTWRITVCETGHKRPWLACAVDEGLIEALASLRKGHNALITSIEPFLMSAFNRCLRVIGGDPSWFVLHEPEHFTLALIARGAWQVLHTRRLNGNVSDALESALARESALIGEDPVSNRVLVCSASAEGNLPARLGNYRVSDVTLSRGVPPELRPYAMALGR